MRSVAEAITDILTHARPLDEPEDVNLLDASGRVLARDVASDVDLPPFRKSAMDGFAARHTDFEGLAEGEGALLRTVGESRAGGPFEGSVAAGTCVAIYTGARVPDDCDVVVMVEKSRSEGEHVRLLDGPRPGQNICNQGEDLRSGATVLRTPRRLSSTDLSVLAAVGCDPVAGSPAAARVHFDDR